MKINATVKVDTFEVGTRARVTIEVDAPHQSYGRQEPLLGTLEKVFTQTRQTTVALLKESAR